MSSSRSCSFSAEGVGAVLRIAGCCWQPLLLIIKRYINSRRTGLTQHVLNLIHPEKPLAPHKPGGYKKRRRHMVLFQNRQRYIMNVFKGVIEGDGHTPGRKLFARLNPGGEFP